jgi:hypothetical protein
MRDDDRQSVMRAGAGGTQAGASASPRSDEVAQ